MVELNAIVLKEGEKLIGVVLPESGKMQAEDLASLINLKTTSAVKDVIKRKSIKSHKVGGKTIVDLKSFWEKTEGGI